jgi:acyl-CoA synthetase (NDP forming)/GNAT superfamily N-acetyltransferase
MFQIIPEARGYSEYALLKDGESVLLRSASERDVPAVESLLHSVSLESLQMRFMGAVAYVARSAVEQMCGGDPQERLCLLALVGEGPEARVAGIGNYVSLGVGATAEVAFLVHDDYQGRGISTLLLERLAGIAAGQGFTGFQAEMLYENQAMANVFRDSGFEVHQAVDGGSIHVEFPLSGLPSLRERVELRERIAAANSLVPLLSPKTVAIVGASRDPSSVGGLIFAALVRANFCGTVYPVNKQATSVHGVRTYASVAELPEAPALVVIAVPAGAVLEVAGQALAAGARGLLVVTSGFAEQGPEGAALQKKLVELVRSRGARLVGPNCLGLMNTHPDVRLNASLAPRMAPRGRIGFYSHSAALGLTILDYAGERGLGFSTFVSAGNRADVSGNDLLQYWEEDPSTDVALLYLETFGNPRRFARIARRVSYRKPILCVKGARSRAGRDAARAHIAAVGQSDTNVDALFRQAGVIRAETLEEMFDVALLLAHQPLPRGPRVAVLSNSGGVLTICADACETHGLEMAGPGLHDLGPLATVEAYEQAVERALVHEEVDALIAIFACIGDCDPKLVLRGIRRGVGRAERSTRVGKPVLLCLMGAAGAVATGAESSAEPLSRHVFPSYRFPESAARALSRACQYAAFRQRPAGRLRWYEDADAAAGRREVQAALQGLEGAERWVEGEAAWRILGHFGIAKGPAEAANPGEGWALEVRSDPSFGPLLGLSRPGAEPVIRITPLTDNDIRELLGTAGLPPDSGMEEIVGRVSQLIEELPWLTGLQAGVRRAGPGVRLGLGDPARLGFRAGASTPPL